MKYIYKTVMLNEFVKSEVGKKYISPKLNQNYLYSATAKMIQALLNYYAKDGWEYWKNDTFSTVHAQSIGSKLLWGNGAGDMFDAPLFIFRKEHTDELQKQFEEDENRELDEFLKRTNNTSEVTKKEMPEVTDARCPNCESLVNKLDDSCWKCQASFGELSAWRPQPI